MKREIICIICKDARLKRYGLYKLAYSKDMQIDYEPFPMEHVKMIKGKARSLFICDTCNKKIEIGDDCFASSTWTDYGSLPYYEWEDEYITHC